MAVVEKEPEGEDGKVSFSWKETVLLVW